MCGRLTQHAQALSLSLSLFYYLQNKANIGQRDGFSQKDVQKLNKMYQCKRKTTKNSTATEMIMDMLGVGSV